MIGDINQEVIGSTLGGAVLDFCWTAVDFYGRSSEMNKEKMKRCRFETAKIHWRFAEM